MFLNRSKFVAQAVIVIGSVAGLVDLDRDFAGGVCLIDVGHGIRPVIDIKSRRVGRGIVRIQADHDGFNCSGEVH